MVSFICEQRLVISSCSDRALLPVATRELITASVCGNDRFIDGRGLDAVSLLCERPPEAPRSPDGVGPERLVSCYVYNRKTNVFLHPKGIGLTASFCMISIRSLLKNLQ